MAAINALLPSVGAGFGLSFGSNFLSLSEEKFAICELRSIFGLRLATGLGGIVDTGGGGGGPGPGGGGGGGGPPPPDFLGGDPGGGGGTVACGLCDLGGGTFGGGGLCGSGCGSGGGKDRG